MVLAISHVALHVALRVALGAGLVACAACNDARLMPLNRTMPLGLLPAATTTQQEHAIEAALARRGWAVVEKKPGRYVARLDERIHMVVVGVDYGPQGISVNYVDSTQLLYKRADDGHEVIHRKYATWVKNLIDDIRNGLANDVASPPPVEPPAPAKSVMNSTPRQRPPGGVPAPAFHAGTG